MLVLVSDTTTTTTTTTTTILPGKWPLKRREREQLLNDVDDNDDEGDDDGENTQCLTANCELILMSRPEPGVFNAHVASLVVASQSRYDETLLMPRRPVQAEPVAEFLLHEPARYDIAGEVGADQVPTPPVHAQTSDGMTRQSYRLPATRLHFSTSRTCASN